VRRDSSQRQGATLGEGVQLIAFSCRLSAFRPGSDYHPPPSPRSLRIFNLQRILR